METYYIYTLEHPITNEIRYVGYTKKSLKQRLAMHIKNVREAENNKRKWNKRISWIKSILTQNLEPIIQEIDTCENKQEAYEKKIYWIEQFKQWNFSLVNMTLGGDGGDTYSLLSIEEKKIAGEKISKKSKGHKPTKETIDKFKQTIKDNGHWLTKPGAIHPMQGKTASQESKDKMSKAKLGRKMPEEQRLARLGNEPGNKNKSKYPSIIQYELDGKELATFAVAGEITRSMGLPTYRQSSIIRCCLGKTKKAFGYKWKFKED